MVEEEKGYFSYPRASWGGKWVAYVDEIRGSRVDVEGTSPLDAVLNYCQKLAFKSFFWRRDDEYYRPHGYPQMPDEAPLLTITQEELESELL